MPTQSDEDEWTAVQVRKFYQRRLGRALSGPRFWTETRVARVVELYQAGETPATITEEFVEYGVKAGTIYWVLSNPAGYRTDPTASIGIALK